MSLNGTLKTRIISSLEKVFADEDLKASDWHSGSMLKNEVYSFQVAYMWDGQLTKQVNVYVMSELSPWITIRKVGLIPSEMPCYADHDDNILRSTPGLYPDVLIPVDADGLTFLPGQWRSIWVTVNHDGGVKAGSYPIKLVFSSSSGDKLGEIGFRLSIINALLPEQSLIHAELLHTDCLAAWYGTEAFSEAHWAIIERYMRVAAAHGVNMVLMPIFTPPLDTAVGGERLTVQLVDVEKHGNTYVFNFEKLERWIDMCRRCGMKYYEITPLFTQWGAKYAPKIMAVEDGEYKRIFGWETGADEECYKDFLARFLPELTAFLKRNGLEKNSYFHISDEPRPEHYEYYKNASAIINKHVKGFHIFDCLSDYKFYEEGLVRIPIPPVDHIEPFIEHGVPDLWTYYCCAQYREVANRFFNMPSARNRIIGMQLYKFDIAGFIHYGYNFWNSQYSRCHIDPYRVTDAGCAFPSGDAFLVYPGKESPVESIRLEVFFEALQDMRALRLLERMVGRDGVVRILEDNVESPITFRQYPADACWLLSKREQINGKIDELLNNKNKHSPLNSTRIPGN